MSKEVLRFKKKHLVVREANDNCPHVAKELSNLKLRVQYSPKIIHAQEVAQEANLLFLSGKFGD